MIRLTRYNIAAFGCVILFIYHVGFALYMNQRWTAIVHYDNAAIQFIRDIPLTAERVKSVNNQTFISTPSFITFDDALKTWKNKDKKSLRDAFFHGNLQMPEACKGKERLWEILLNVREYLWNTRLSITLEEHCEHLPTWKDVTALYGSEPVVIGLERCEEYRAHIQKANEKPLLKIAGLYNSGTNVYARLLDRNIIQHPRYGRKGRPLAKPTPYEQVPWGKHCLAKYRGKTLAIGEVDVPVESVLPIVIIRDPYRWMVSMVGTISNVYSTCPVVFNEPQSPIPVQAIL
jgi:hypothetical protein